MYGRARFLTIAFGFGAAASSAVVPARLHAEMNKTPGVSLIRPVSPRGQPAVALHHLKSGEDYTLALFDKDGGFRSQARSELRSFLACSKTGEDHPIHLRLASILHAIGAHWPGKTIDVISGYRHPTVSRHTRRSNHTRGRAIDIRVRGVSPRLVRDSIRRSFVDVGVGYYPNSRFVHLDIREMNSQWIDYAGPGESPCYSKTVDEDLNSGIAEQLAYDEAIARGCKGRRSGS